MRMEDYARVSVPGFVATATFINTRLGWLEL
jgi:hypothetical protein